MPRLEKPQSFRQAPLPVLMRKVEQVVATETARSLLFRNEELNPLPRFDRSEVVTGRVVGRGTYAVVREITSINLMISGRVGEGPPPTNVASHYNLDRSNNETLSRSDSSHKPRNGPSDNLSLSGSSHKPRNGHTGGVRQYFRQSSSSVSRSTIINANERDLTTRELLARRVWSRKGNKYVVKEIEKSLLQTDRVTFLKGMIDLLLEAKFLAALSHPHIIRLQGFSSYQPCQQSQQQQQPGTAGGEGSQVSRPAPIDMSSFLILEHLEETLPRRLNAWMHQKRATRGLTGILSGGRRLRTKSLLTERLLVAHDVADAMDYLHRRDIIYRDLKPDNVGFTKSSELKLFDFGLAKELLDRDRQEDGKYLLTGLTGSIRYMAPEVGLQKPYNSKADVYSWSMLMWYIMALEPPFGMYTVKMFLDRVFAKHYRPAVKEKWPEQISTLMQDCWNVDPDLRPSFANIMTRLTLYVAELDPEVASFMNPSVVVEL